MASAYLLDHPVFRVEGNNEFKDKAANFGNSLLYAAAGTADFLASIPLVLANLVTLGKIHELNGIAIAFTELPEKSLQHIYTSSLKILFPDANFVGRKISNEGDAIISDVTTRRLRHLTRKTRVSHNWFHRNITTRGITVLALLTSPLARTLDLAISIVIIPTSFLTGGRIGDINNLAYRSLNFPRILSDINYFGTRIVFTNLN